MSLDHGGINNQSNFTNDGVIDNGGLIDNFCTWFGGPFPLCQLYNHGTITNQPFGGLRNLCNTSALCYMYNFGTIDNSGGVEVTCTAGSADKCNNVFFNYNYLINRGTLQVGLGGILVFGTGVLIGSS